METSIVYSVSGSRIIFRPTLPPAPQLAMLQPSCKPHVADQALAMVGYSGTPLPEKLGIKPGTIVVAIDAPGHYRKLVHKIPRGVNFATSPVGKSNFVHLFVKERRALEKHLQSLRRKIADDATVWVSWPKKSANVPTDVTEDIIRAVALPLGFVDVKVCAVDETWSGLKLMIRPENRKSKSK